MALIIDDNFSDVIADATHQITYNISKCAFHKNQHSLTANQGVHGGVGGSNIQWVDGPSSPEVHVNVTIMGS